VNPQGPQTHSVVWWAIGLAFIWFGLRAFEQLNVYAPYKPITAHPGTYGMKYWDLMIPTEDGAQINAWYVPLSPDKPVILYSHGNGGNMSTRMEMVKRLREAGANVLLYDYRGYGRSPGTPTELGTYRDGEAAYRWLLQQPKIKPENVVFFGESLGCGVAVELARRHPGRGLILEAGFTSIVAMGKTIFPSLPVQWLTRYRYDNLAKIGQIPGPVLVMHSPQDEIIPFEMGRALFAAAREPKTFFEMTGDHNEGFMVTGPSYTAAIKSFLAAPR
jgi:fermentation-respiration switch protein FrsA (DUF1100 family)